MPTFGPHNPRRSDNSLVDATFELTPVPVFELVYHHKAGARGDPRAVNSDYNEGLELLLERLASVGCTGLGITVDSSVAREIMAADRELQMDFPVNLLPDTDVHTLRVEIGRAQKPIASRARPGAGRGNSQRRIRITLAMKRYLTGRELKALLIEPPQKKN